MFHLHATHATLSHPSQPEKNWGKAPLPGNAWILAGLDEGNGGLVYQPPNGKIAIAPDSHGKSLP